MIHLFLSKTKLYRITFIYKGNILDNKSGIYAVWPWKKICHAYFCRAITFVLAILWSTSYNLLEVFVFVPLVSCYATLMNFIVLKTIVLALRCRYFCCLKNDCKQELQDEMNLINHDDNNDNDNNNNSIKNFYSATFHEMIKCALHHLMSALSLRVHQYTSTTESTRCT